jgi:hypothetical protein
MPSSGRYQLRSNQIPRKEENATEFIQISGVKVKSTRPSTTPDPLFIQKKDKSA